MRTGLGMRAPLLAIASTAALALAGCGDDTRSAEAETSVSEAEVQTDLPENVVSDEQLQATADAAAELAATPPAQIVPVPVGQTGGAGQAGAGGQAGIGGQAGGAAGQQGQQGNRVDSAGNVTADPEEQL